MVQVDNFNILSLIGHFSVFVKFWNNCVRVGLLNMNIGNVIRVIQQQYNYLFCISYNTSIKWGHVHINVYDFCEILRLSGLFTDAVNHGGFISSVIAE